MQAGRKAQAALEFLMTYGWAILVVLVVIGAMAYFGVLSPSNLLPEKCTFSVSFSCKDFYVGSNGLQVTLQNSGGKDVKVTSVSFTSDALNSLSGTCGTGAISAMVKNGAQATFYATDPLNCAFKDAGRPKNKYTAQVIYQLADSAIPHIASGELLARAESSAVSAGSGSYGGGSSDPALRAYWGFEDGSGVSGTDSSGNGNTGTLVNFACTTLNCNPASGWVSPGRVGNAIAFDGQNDYARVTNSPSVDITGDQFSVSMWVNPSIAQTDKQLVVKNIGSGLGGWRVTYTDPNRVIFQIPVTPWSNGLLSSSKFVPGQWHHLAATYNGNTMTIYVDGAYDNSMPRTGNINPGTASDLFIGSWFGSSAYFNGAVDEFRVWNRALSPAEVASLASQ